MKILFTFENPLPSPQADAEVFVTTARYLAPLISQAWLHVPVAGDADLASVGALAGMPAIRAYAPMGYAPLRHFCCGLTLVFRTAFRQADLVYTRNLWIAWMAILFRRNVVFDHYRPWPDQIPPLQFWIYRMMCNTKFLINICHSDYTRAKYLNLGVPADKVRCIRNGFEPSRLLASLPIAAAKQKIGVASGQKTVVYIGRLNHKKGLELAIDAAKQLPNLLFILVGSHGDGAIEKLSHSVANIRIVPWQQSEALGPYVFAADVLLIPPSSKPLAQFGSTVLPLKLFFYLASGRPILAGSTPDVTEVLRHRENAYLCSPDSVAALVDGLRTLTQDRILAARLASTASADSHGLTWEARARKIVEVMESRLFIEQPRCGGWSSVQRRTWIHQSWRWLAHLVRRHSWVLPPDANRPVAPSRASAS